MKEKMVCRTCSQSKEMLGLVHSTRSILIQAATILIQAASILVEAASLILIQAATILVETTSPILAQAASIGLAHGRSAEHGHNKCQKRENVENLQSNRMNLDRLYQKTA